MIQSGDEPIPGYRVERKLGSGQYGEVWQATSPGRTALALKFLDMTGRQGWKEFRAVQRVKRIRHAHLMPIISIWLLDADGKILTDDAVDSLTGDDETADTLAADSEAATKRPARMVIATLLGDGSLRDRLDECVEEGLESIPRDELLVYMEEAAKGIDFLNSVQHEVADDLVGVQHCDIKPDNIMLTGGSVVIGDFGVAQLLAGSDEDARATSLSGSPAYMAPEAFEAKPTPSSDQYSLAVTYYELRTGILPVEQATFAAVYEAHRTGALDFSRVPEHEQKALRRATQIDPDQRFDSTADFVAALRETPVTHAPRRRSWWPQVAALVVAVAAAAVLSLIIVNRGPGQVEIELRFDVPEARVLVNGEQHTADANGELSVEASRGEPLLIRAAENPGRQDREWTISAAELEAKSAFELEVPYTPEHHAAQAEQLLASGQLKDAASAFAVAMKDDPGAYAQLPGPVTREVPGVMWDDCLQVTLGGEWVVIGGRDGVVRRWRLTDAGIGPDAEQLAQHEDARIVCLAVADNLVASACDRGAVWISDRKDKMRLVEGDGAEVDLSFTGGGETLVAAISGDLKTEVYAWRFPTVSNPPSRRLIGEQPGEFPRLVRSLGESVVLATMDDDALVWRWRVDSADHQELGRQQNEVLCLAASASGGVVGYAGVANSDGVEAAAAVVDVSEGVRCVLSTQQADSIPACAVDPSGKRFATAERMSEFERSGNVVLWRPEPAMRVATPDRVLDYDRALGDPSALCIVSDSQWVAAGHELGGVSLWRLRSTGSDPLVSIGRGDRVMALRGTPDGRWMLSASRDGRLMVFDLWRLEMVLRACEQAGVTPEPPEDERQTSRST